MEYIIYIIFSNLNEFFFIPVAHSYSNYLQKIEFDGVCVKWKLNILEYMCQKHAIRETAQKFSIFGTEIQPYEFCKYQQKKYFFLRRRKFCTDALTTYVWPLLREKRSFEKSGFDWILMRQNLVFVTSTSGIFRKEASLQTSFEDEDAKMWNIGFISFWYDGICFVEWQLIPLRS